MAHAGGDTGNRVAHGGVAHGPIGVAHGPIGRAAWHMAVIREIASVPRFVSMDEEGGNDGRTE